MIDDQVRHQLVGLAKALDVLPRAQTRVQSCVVNGLGACIRAVDRMEERQQMSAAEYSFERVGQERRESRQDAARDRST